MYSKLYGKAFEIQIQFLNLNSDNKQNVEELQIEYKEVKEYI